MKGKFSVVLLGLVFCLSVFMALAWGEEQNKEKSLNLGESQSYGVFTCNSVGS
jgi:hypothetical protein